MHRQPFAFIPGESFHGAVARWADQVGGLERMSDLTSVAGVQYGHRQNSASSRPEDIRTLAALMDVDPVQLLDRATPRIGGDEQKPNARHHFFGTTVPPYLLEKRYRRFSPGAFTASLAAEDIKAAYDRAIWHIRLFPFDVETWEFLIDQCPSPDCGRRPGWQHTLGIDRCEHCMADLKTAPTTMVPKDLRPNLELAVGLLHPDPALGAASLAALPPELAAAGSSTALDLLMRLIPVVDPGIAHQVSNYLQAPKEQLARAVSAAWKVVAGWPEAMNLLVSSRIATRTTRHSDGNGGRTSRFLSPRRIAELPHPLQGMVSAWRDSINLQGPSGARLLETTSSITDVAKQMGLGSAIVADLRRSGAVRTILVLDSDRTEPRLLRSEFDDLHRRLGTRLPIDSARLPLGVSWHGVEQLVAMRLLDRETHPYFEARYGSIQIVASSVSELVTRVTAEAVGDAGACTLPLHSAMKAVGKRMKPWGPAFAALLEKRLPFVVTPGTKPLSRRILVERGCVEFVRGLLFDPRDPAYIQLVYATHMSKIEAGDTLNLGFSQSIPLLSGIETKTGTREKLVPVHYVLDLANTHISCTELAARRGVSTQRAYWDAIKTGVPDLGSGGFCRTVAEEKFFGGDASTDRAT
jgi:hypothetical protein